MEEVFELDKKGDDGKERDIEAESRHADFYIVFHRGQTPVKSRLSRRLRRYISFEEMTVICRAAIVSPCRRASTETCSLRSK